VLVIAATAADGWDRAAIWREQLNDDMGQIIQEVEV
jgi:hypothetical protein